MTVSTVLTVHNDWTQQHQTRKGTKEIINVVEKKI
jgi:hypothetical protein